MKVKVRRTAPKMINLNGYGSSTPSWRTYSGAGGLAWKGLAKPRTPEHSNAQPRRATQSQAEPPTAPVARYSISRERKRFCVTGTSRVSSW
jgi:hypothetical protein